MQTIRTTQDLQHATAGARQARKRLALVPTMGALHRGHLSLVRRAKEVADHVTVSIFVNPTQFGPAEDLDRYPRTFEADVEALESVGGVDVVFAPTDQAMYPVEPRTWVEVDGFDQHLCGAGRPGHFRGVSTIVTKLFIAATPDVAIFGLKDAQQFFLLKRMTLELGFPIELIGAPIVREDDGLAFSSRNRYLSAAHRTQAVVLSQAVRTAGAMVEDGELRSEALVGAMLQTLATAPDAEVEYAEVVDTATLHPVARLLPDQEVLAAVAARFGSTRLIDNCIVRVPAA
ncbi:MAG: pantoate--beta-alanine ligase [Bacteroidota bacterium]